MKKHSARYKDSVFCMLFGDPDKLRRLYNALTGSAYSKETPVTVTTLRNVLSEGLRNDIAFTIGGKTVVLIEHQSTINPNMPIRLLLYIAAVYEQIIPRRDLYSRRKIKIPRPEFYIFYNGLSPFPDTTVLKLSQSFEDASPGAAKISLELEALAYNINAGYNTELLEKSGDLGEYARFVAMVREKQAGEKDKEEQEEAFRLAIKECIDNNILKEFLERHREEVMHSLLSISREEFLQIRAEEDLEDAREEGLAKGREEGRAEALQEAGKKNLESARKLKALGLSPAQIAEALGISPQEIEKL